MSFFDRIFGGHEKRQAISCQDSSLQKGECYVMLSTSLDGNVCPICAQFEGKYFKRSDAPQLPLCPSCRCAYAFYFGRESLPDGAVISSKNDFILPAKCVGRLQKNQQMIYEERDIKKRLQLCEEGLKLLPEFMAPYLKGGFPAPRDIACRDISLELYLRLGDWNNALRVIQFCISSNAYYPNSGEEQLLYLRKYSETATAAISYIEENPGVPQKSIYNKLCPPLDREMLKKFTRTSFQIFKEPSGNTNRLYVKK